MGTSCAKEVAHTSGATLSLSSPTLSPTSPRRHRDQLSSGASSPTDTGATGKGRRDSSSDMQNKRRTSTSLPLSRSTSTASRSSTFGHQQPPPMLNGSRVMRDGPQGQPSLPDLPLSPLGVAPPPSARMGRVNGLVTVASPVQRSPSIGFATDAVNPLAPPRTTTATVVHTRPLNRSPPPPMQRKHSSSKRTTPLASFQSVLLDDIGVNRGASEQRSLSPMAPLPNSDFPVVTSSATSSSLQDLVPLHSRRLTASTLHHANSNGGHHVLGGTRSPRVGPQFRSERDLSGHSSRRSEERSVTFEKTAVRFTRSLDDDSFFQQSCGDDDVLVCVSQPNTTAVVGATSGEHSQHSAVGAAVARDTAQQLAALRRISDVALWCPAETSVLFTSVSFAQSQNETSQSTILGSFVANGCDAHSPPTHLASSSLHRESALSSHHSSHSCADEELVSSSPMSYREMDLEHVRLGGAQLVPMDL